ncbi:Threonine efflux protein [Tsuneonella dongtanensis]|uniref:Threonine efflux protein n=1 Tax=Tsuneonella dongtanensis TaxID=692370 RepID=A0A1B2A922_9SPHN|nr:LysE family translocator [Tsuneonella dongtanensis]ANY18611.1 Threonine efflux protein [Tsuneonella dongtanensis]
MIDTPLLLAFIAAAALLAITPGVDTAIVLRAAAVDGKRSALLAALGIGTGCLAWALAVSLGLGPLLAASEMAYTALKLAGATYLVWLGARMLMQPRGAFAPDVNVGTGRGAFARGLFTNLLNPKVGGFYVSFLPQFVPAGADLASSSLILACIHIALSLAWFGAIIAATGQIGRLLRRPGAVGWLDRATGVVLVGFGLRLALSTRS